jgi:hypothetical protein
MKKLLFLAVSFTALTITANAQPKEGFNLGAGLRASLPIGDFSDSHSFGLGAELQGEYGFAENFSGVFTTGYSSFFGKKYDIGGMEFKADAVGYIPILAGVRYYAAPSFFIGGQLGYGLLTGNGDSEGAFNYQPQIGYNSGSFQVALNYNALSKEGSTISHLGLAAIFLFGGDKK